MLSLIRTLAASSLYWWLLLLGGIAFESVALFYQHVLDYGPCPLCIHVRIGVASFMLVSIVALLFRNIAWWRFSHLLNIVIMGWLTERAYLLLGTERGFVYIECGVDSGLPSWFALDQWFPPLFAVMESCGYTPLLPLGISMAEALMALSPLLVLISLLMMVMSYSRPAN